MWESLAICEYCAEFNPALWPVDRIARRQPAPSRPRCTPASAPLRRAHADDPRRATGGRRPHPPWRRASPASRTSGAETRTHTQRPTSTAPVFGAADAMFAPVVARLPVLPARAAPRAMPIARPCAHTHSWPSGTTPPRASRPDGSLPITRTCREHRLRTRPCRRCRRGTSRRSPPYAAARFHLTPFARQTAASRRRPDRRGTANRCIMLRTTATSSSSR